MGRFEEDDRAFLAGQGGQALPPGAAFRGKESLEAEAAAGQTAAHQGGGDGTGPGDADHLMACAPGGGGQLLAGVGDARQAGIADQGHRFARLQGRQQLGQAGGPVVLVEAHQGHPDAEVVQQQTAAAGVLAGHPVGAGQHPPGPGGEVVQVADGGAHQIQNAGGGFRLLHRVLHNASFTLPMMPSPIALPDGIERESLLAELRRLAWGAADILRAYARGEQPPHGFPRAMSVDDGGEGPVSAADLAVNRWLLDGLARAFPDAGWTLLSEETAAEVLVPGRPLEAEWLWILDPLDGTKDFLQGTGEYAVHLALVHRQRPVLGVVLLPEPEELWFGLLPSVG